MVKILFIVPYPDLEDTVAYVASNHVFREATKVDVKVRTVDQALELDTREYDAIIARGYTASRMEEKWPDKTIIKLQVSGFDILRAVAECKERFRPYRIAVLQAEQQMLQMQDISMLLGVELELYEGVPYESLDGMVRKAVSNGCDVLVGGYSSKLAAEKAGLSAVVIRSGENAVLRAIEEAVYTVDRVRKERIIAQTYKTVIYASRDGILYVDRDGIIRVRNHAIRQMNSGKSLLNKPLKDVLPYLYELFQKVMNSNDELSGQVLTVPGTKTVVSVALRSVTSDREIAGVVITVSDITEIQRLESQIRRKLNEHGLKAKYTFQDISHESDVMARTIQRAQYFAGVDSNVIIVGETGTGKELFAQSIHQASGRGKGPFVVINCAAIPEELLESELFGYAEGAFTGALKGGKMGLFELAHGGTLFLDEIEEMPLPTQTKLLRVLQERQVRRVGGNTLINVDVRIISATNKSIRTLIHTGKFRKDLLYRLDVLRLFVPPLRSRGRDMELLFNSALKDRAEKGGFKIPIVTKEAFKLLHDYPFEGNIRELNNIADRVASAIYIEKGINSVITIDEVEMCEALYPPDLEEDAMNMYQNLGDNSYGDLMESRESLNASIIPNLTGNMKKCDEEIRRILEALKECDNNYGDAADYLGMHRTTLWRKMKRYGLNIK